MKEVVLVRYGEIALKGLNRAYFEDTLKNNIAKRLRKFKDVTIKKAQSRLEVHFTESAQEEIIESIKNIFGIAYISKALIVDSDIEQISKAALSLYEEGKSFKIETRRGDKNFYLKSPEISAQVGAYVLSNSPCAKVDVINPETVIEVEVRKSTYVYKQSYKCRAGLPTSTGGKAALLLSGGIDSPVAGYMMASRGVELVCVYFHSSPYTPQEAKQKVVDLAKTLNDFAPGVSLYSVPFTKIQESIIERCDIKYLTILMRRYMMIIAEKIARKNNAKALITGESLGQVASQTIESIYSTNEVCKMPVFRPLIGFDKINTINIAKDIGTYDISVLTYEDCCTIFTPKHPQTRPKIDLVLEQEEKLSDIINEYIEQAVKDAEIIKF
ncbi:MAG: tRNA 4-thiouridine(8) synthase ThiI [Eubacteriaceae bacterium]|nr:tRNA 4-thiouridine(8) synthase ThiI [Eubacteriaceae bacterium]